MAFWDTLLNVFGIDDFTDALVTISTATSLVSTGLSAYGDYKEAEAAQQSAQANAAIYDQNARFAETQAQDAVQRGRLDVRKVRLGARQLIGAQRAALAANNVRIDSGSAAALQRDTTLMADADAFTILENARRDATGYRQQGANYTAQAEATRAGARDISPILAATPTIVGGATSIADRWLRYRDG